MPLTAPAYPSVAGGAEGDMSDTEFLGGLTYFTAVFAAVLALPITWLLLRQPAAARCHGGR